MSREAGLAAGVQSAAGAGCGGMGVLQGVLGCMDCLGLGVWIAWYGLLGFGCMDCLLGVRVAGCCDPPCGAAAQARAPERHRPALTGRPHPPPEMRLTIFPPACIASPRRPQDAQRAVGHASCVEDVSVWCQALSGRRAARPSTRCSSWARCGWGGGAWWPAAAAAALLAPPPLLLPPLLPPPAGDVACSAAAALAQLPQQHWLSCRRCSCCCCCHQGRRGPVLQHHSSCGSC